MDVVELARTLVNIPSESGEEGRIGVYIADKLEADGWQVIRQEVPGSRNDLPRLNVLAVVDTEEAPEVVLTTHIDTVPPFIPLSEDEAYLYGRGTCDAKGIFAAQWVAADALRRSGQTRIALLAVVGEETDSLGAKAVPKILPRAKWIIDGEPTELRFAKSAKGVLSLSVRVKGVAAHSAYPEKGHSATHDLVFGLGRLLEAELPFEAAFGPTTVNIGHVAGGLAPNVIAPQASASVMIRLGTSVERVKRQVSELLGPEFEVEVVSESEPQDIFVPETDEGILVRFGSDVPHLRSIGTPLLMGPGTIHDAHTSHEKVKKADLVEATRIYQTLSESLLGS